MGYFSNIAEAAFKDNPEGDGWLYYPSGIFRKGYLVTDINYKEKLFKHQKRVYIFLISFGFLYGISLDIDNLSLSNLIPIIIVLMPIYIRQYFLIRKLPKSNIKLKYKEASQKVSKGFSIYYVYFLYFSSAWLTVTALVTPILFDKPFSEVKGLAYMLFGFAFLSLILALHLHKLKKSNKRL